MSTARDKIGIEVICTGTPRDMGWAQGSMLRSKIRDAIQTCSSQESFRLDQPRWLPTAAYLWLAERKASRMLRSPLHRDAPEMLDRLVGISQGAGVRLGTMLLANAIEPFMSSVRERCEVHTSAAACSAIAVRGRRSASGSAMIARNFDYFPFIQPYFTLRDNRPSGGHRSIDFTVATMAGAVDGINDRGLCVTYNYAYAVDDGSPSAPVSSCIADVLGSCSTVAEAADRIAKRPRWGGAILMLADASGDIASLELSNTRSRLRRPDDGENLLFHTNEFQVPDMRPTEVSHEARFGRRAHPAMRGRRVLESAELRARRIGELLRPRNCLSADDLAGVLADHGPDRNPSETSVCVHGRFRQTAACLQLFPQTRRMRIAYDLACTARFHEFAL